MLQICTKFVSNHYIYFTFAYQNLSSKYMYLPHFSRQRKCNANLELQIYHIFAPFANISKSVFSSSVTRPWRSPKPAQQVSVCLGQIVILATCSSDKPRVPALAKMSSFSLTLLHLDKWQLFKCDVISSMHSETNTFLSTPLLGPHSVYTISQKEQLDETAE